MHAQVCMRTHTHTQTHTHTHTHTNKRIHERTHMHTHTHKRTHRHTHTRINEHINAHTHTHHTLSHTNFHTHQHTNTHPFTHASPLCLLRHTNTDKCLGPASVQQTPTDRPHLWFQAKGSVYCVHTLWALQTKAFDDCFYSALFDRRVETVNQSSFLIMVRFRYADTKDFQRRSPSLLLFCLPTAF